MIVYGINPVLEALRAGRITAIRVSQRGGGRMQDLLALASERGVKVQRVDGVVVAAGGVVLGGQSQGGLHSKKPGTISAGQQDAAELSAMRRRSPA